MSTGVSRLRKRRAPWSREQGAVRVSPDWTTRIGYRRIGRGPTGWDWSSTFRRHAAALTREPWLTLDDIGISLYTNVAYAREARWACASVAHAGNREWAASLARFYRLFLLALPLPCGDHLTGRDNRLYEPDWRDKRSSRH